jgi:transketolase
VGARVVSAPCLEWFAEQSEEYRESVLPAAITARVSVEAGATPLWKALVGDKGRTVGIDHFGASASYETLFEKFGITTEAVVNAARETLKENA